MGAVATWSYTTWKALYPVFDATVNEVQADDLFSQALFYWPNDGSGPVGDAALQLSLLNVLVAHLAQLSYPPGGATGLVGRISSASEGSVSVSTDFQGTANAAWFNQTVYGAKWWQMTAGYRTMRYRVPFPRVFNPPRSWGYR